MAKADQIFADHLGMALDASEVHDFALEIDDAERGLLRKDINADVVLLAHKKNPGLVRSTTKPLPPREAPQYPI